MAVVVVAAVLVEELDVLGVRGVVVVAEEEPIEDESVEEVAETVVEDAVVACIVEVDVRPDVTVD